ncbi:MAG: MBL fold metallo-hydrolase [Alphaproteobacteria bacterium]|nr:MBL fold metallo-hydrolase [Alphaproteobacteria bacterium]
MRWIWIFAWLSLTAAALAADEVAPGVALVSGGAYVLSEQPDGNSVLFDAPGGVIVFDTGRHAAHTRKVLDQAAAMGQPVVAVINSHWHLDHVGGNPTIRRAFPAVHIFASAAIKGARAGFLAKYRQDLFAEIAKLSDPVQKDGLLAEIAIVDAGPALEPDVVIEASGPRTIAGRTLDIHLERNAVTAGDVWLFDPKTRVLLAGDLVTLPAPFLDTACPRRWSAALAQLERATFTTLIPGHGPPLSRTQFAAYRTAYDRLLACAASKASNDACGAGWVRDAGALVPETDQKAAKALIGYYMEASLRAAPEQLAKLCGAP